MATLGLLEQLPRTESGALSSKEEDLLPYSHIPFISDYLEYNKLEKSTSFVRDITTDKVHPRYNLLMNTGRTSCNNPNFQQLPREGAIRNMFRASPGNTLIITDYSTVELATLAQHVYSTQGKSKMRELINDGVDLHKYYASILLKKDINEITKQERQYAKAANFGFPGGLGISKFTHFAKKSYGLDLDEKEARKMKNAWFKAFPEMRQYMQSELGESWTLTGRKRAKTTYCAEKNTPFQGLAADGAKIALYYLQTQGHKIVGFVHDEIITEIDRNNALKNMSLQENVMINAMKQVCPDVEIKVESTISEVYCK
jgi:DNA polymerase-1